TTAAEALQHLPRARPTLHRSVQVLRCGRHDRCRSVATPSGRASRPLPKRCNTVRASVTTAVEALQQLSGEAAALLATLQEHFGGFFSGATPFGGRRTHCGQDAF